MPSRDYMDRDERDGHDDIIDADGRQEIGGVGRYRL